ncbi:hypothetical protein [Sphaerimonospora thailandensis]|uniref:DUF3800 domain-containing protein n=1 Tax=Sphaerimonospora thailandensis TaxID=795644 RepID=A0A8J3W2B8_9ACTN|nr:hypothetical protein [Sphaerimonospora thailandensis]GIH72631.1 hypothetical protein Mth01_48840 [Sphaerimonospora thailandensis]
MLTAYIDESLRRRPHDDSVYAMAAVIIDSADHGDVRTELESLRLGKSPRLHWRDESPARQLAITERLVNMPIQGIVTVYLHGKEVRTERARRRCLERLLIEVEQTGVSTVVIESRSPEQDHLDRGLLTGLRTANVLPKSLTVIWKPSVSEPLLWAADAVVSATTWWLDGRARYYDLLVKQVRAICLE